MSSNKFMYIVLLSLILFACSNKKEEKSENNLNNANIPGISASLNNPDSLKKYLHAALSAPSMFTYPGKFDEDSVTHEYAAGTEISTKKESGIKFSLLKPDKDKLIISYQSRLLKGSFTKSAQRIVRPKGFTYDMIYYSSLNYFMGAKFGEVFSYLIDFKNKEIYYSHLFTTDGNSFSIFLSENIKDKSIKDYLLTPFQKDFSSALIVKKDVDLDNL